MTLEQSAASFGGNVWGTLSTPAPACSRLPLPGGHWLQNANADYSGSRPDFLLGANKPGGSLIIPQRARLSHWACSVARPRSGGEWLSWAQGLGRRPLWRGFQECGPGAAAPEPGTRRAPRSPPGRRAQPEPRRSGTEEPPTSRQVRNRPPGEPCK